MQRQVKAISPSKQWIFQNGRLICGDLSIEPFTVDFWERWTLAKFLQEGQLALAFESGQPYNEYGSYGNRLWGVQVLRQTDKPEVWDTVALEYECRDRHEFFVPDDICWHSRGVLAWLCEGEIYVQVLKVPRSIISWWELLPPADSEENLDYFFDDYGSWKTLIINDEGNQLVAIDEIGHDRFDLKRRLRQRDDQAWTAIQIVCC